MTDASNTRERGTPPTLDESDPELYYEEDEKDEDSEDTERGESDISSILSDDSVYPIYEHAPSDSNDSTELTLYQCCIKNNAMLLQQRLHQGVTKEEVMELDINGRNGLLVACFQGFIDIVTVLSKCPYLDINHQDNDGNTALMIAAQAGADMTAVDPVKGKTAREWAALTGRFETIVRIRTLLQRPCAEQFSNKYLPQWPALPELVAETLATSRAKRLTNRICSTFTINFPHDPEPDGVMDHMVRMTTCLASPFVATACQTICPESPPEVGKQRLSVPEILKEYKPDPDAKSMASASSCNGQLMTPTRVLVPYQPPSTLVKFLSIPLRLRRNSVFPAGIPKIELTRSPAQSVPKEKKPRRSKNKNTLELPKWRYKELKEEKKKAAEEAGKSKKQKGKEKSKSKK
ncbi:hypothetical protein JD844_011070 [Phrynosoma platyrhinos]|uniref:Ankyrin repeat domain-containing protein 33B n=1 Tax=Phrynosoma platyrhinos TaxID=52577 RepID=A0ABQ7THF5_PHRPL|nr:hypothetical protein JD844_011070 [Phrynosoma platyrhinos]